MTVAALEATIPRKAHTTPDDQRCVQFRKCGFIHYLCSYASGGKYSRSMCLFPTPVSYNLLNVECALREDPLVLEKCRCGTMCQQRVNYGR